MPQAAPLQPDDPARLGSYDLLGRLGEGGQGVVYLAQATAGGPYCAVKLLHSRLTGDMAERERFMRELAAAKKVARFCTAQVLDAELAGDRPYIVSEYVTGRSLHSRIAEDGPRTGGALERLAIGTLTALTAIHRAGVVHRDFTPRNVLLGPDGPRVIDFGIARALDTSVTDDTMARGTPAYMAPEQVSGGAMGPATDMFAWAVTILYAATGVQPFGGGTLPAVINRVLHHEPDVSGLPEPLRSVVSACLSKDPAQRPTAHQAQEWLLGDAPPPLAARTDGYPSAEAAGPPRSPAVRKVATVALAGLAVAAMIATGLWAATKPSGPENRTAGVAPAAQPQSQAGQATPTPTPGDSASPDPTNSGKGKPPTAKPTTKKPKPPPPDGCRRHERGFTIKQQGKTAGKVQLTTTICRKRFHGTARVSDALAGNGWGVCVQINGHVRGTATNNSGTYVGTRFMSSGNAVFHRFSQTSERRLDWAYVNLGNCRGNGGNVEWDYQYSAQIAAA